MPATDLYARHLSQLRAQTGPLTEQLLDGWELGLREACSGARDDSRSASALLRQLQTERGPLREQLQQAMEAAISDAQARRRPGLAAGGKASTGLDQLSLVDEEQAERDIEISRLVQLTDLRAEWELRELLGLVAALEPDAADVSRYPAAPAVFARAIGEAAQRMATVPATRALLMRLAMPLCADALKALYAQAAQALQSAGAVQAPYRRLAPAVARIDVAQPGALTELLARLPAQRAPASANAAAGGPTLQALPSERAAAPAAMDPRQALLSALFAQMVSDPRLEQPVREAISRLEQAVLRMAPGDPSLMGSQEHPAWSLVNQIAVHAGDHPQGLDPRGADFLRFVEPLLERLSAAAQPSRAAFEAALDDVQSFIERDEAQQLERSAPAVRVLSQAEREQELLPLLQQQLDMQMRKVGPITDQLRRFLSGPWAELLAQVMAREGDDSPAAQQLLATADELLASLQTPPSEAARQRLVARLPDLIERVQQGMRQLQLPQPHCERVLNDLMQTHRRALFVPAPDLPAAPAVPVPPTDEDDAWWADVSRPSATSAPAPLDAWQTSDTNLGALPTVPMRLDEEAATAWLLRLRVGVRCKLFLQGQWTTARMIWRSDNAQFFMFSSPLAGGSHSMTRRALERLRAEGLATDVAESSLLQRAVNGLLQGAADNSADAAL